MTTRYGQFVLVLLILGISGVDVEEEDADMCHRLRRLLIRYAMALIHDQCIYVRWIDVNGTAWELHSKRLNQSDYINVCSCCKSMFTCDTWEVTINVDRRETGRFLSAKVNRYFHMVQQKSKT